MFIILNKNKFPIFKKDKNGRVFIVMWENLGYSGGFWLFENHDYETQVLTEELEEINEIITISQS